MVSFSEALCWCEGPESLHPPQREQSFEPRYGTAPAAPLHYVKYWIQHWMTPERVQNAAQCEIYAAVFMHILNLKPSKGISKNICKSVLVVCVFKVPYGTVWLVLF